MLFFVLCFSIILGIISAVSGKIIIILVGLILFLIFFYKQSFIKILACLGVFIFFFTLTNISIQERENSFSTFKNITENFSGNYKISGKITHFLYGNDLQNTYRLKIDKIANNSTTYILPSEKDIGIFLSIPKNLDIEKGDTIEFYGKLQNIIEPKTDFSSYAWLKKGYARSSAYKFIRTPQKEKYFINSLQEKIKNIITRGFPQNISALLLGITIGNTDYMNQEMKAEFKNAGLTHILVVSGSNIAFVILIFSFILSYIPVHRFIKYGIILFFLGFYGTLVGWGIPVIRATIMGIISYFSIRGGKKLHSVSILFLIGGIFLIFEPLILVYDASFGLSFTATLGILLFNQKIEHFLQKFISSRIIITSISVTLSASLGSFGTLLYYFGNINFFGIFANILIGSVMGLLLILTTIYIFFGFFLPDIVLYYFGFGIYIIAEYIFLISGYFGQFSPIPIPYNIKTPLSIIIYFVGFLYILENAHNQLMKQKNHLKKE